MVAEISSRKRGMEAFALTLAAGAPQRVVVEGDYFHVLTAPVADLQARFNNGKQVPVYEGVGFRRYYEEFELSSATGQTVIVLAGFGSVADGRATANVNVAATVAAGNTLADGSAVTCAVSSATQLLAADASRTYAVIKNISTNTLTMYIGTSAVDADSGIPLEPGETLPIATTAAIYAYNADASLTENLYAASVREV